MEGRREPLVLPVVLRAAWTERGELLPTVRHADAVGVHSRYDSRLVARAVSVES